MSLKTDYENLLTRYKEDYQNYKDETRQLIKEYREGCDKYNLLVGTINSERLSFRKEIRELYDFLQLIGGNLNKEKKISIFDFVDETPAPVSIQEEININNQPELTDNGLLDALNDGVIGTFLNHKKNKDKYEKLNIEVGTKCLEYKKNISDRKNEIAYINDANEIASIYRQVLVTVRDAISEIIIPELDVIQSFLYADAIRELILDGEEPQDVEPCVISEYKGTNQDIHYRFVKNTFDFYKISTAFFKNAILSNILEDRVVSEEEKKTFNKEIKKIKKQISLLEENQVISNE